MNFKNIVPSDLKQINDLQPQGWSGVASMFDYYIQHAFCTAIKVIYDGKLAAVGTAIFFENSAWLAHIIVAAEYQKQGIGTALLLYLINTVQKKGITTISLIATELGFPLYKKAGFKDQTQYLLFEREQPILQIDFDPKISKIDSSDTKELLQLDRSIFGENREIIITEYLKDGLCYRSDNCIEGYYLPKLGEGLVAANSKHAGKALLQKKLEHSKTITVPMGNEQAVKLLVKNGYVERKRMWRMIYGEEFKWRPDNLYSRIAGYLG